MLKTRHKEKVSSPPPPAIESTVMDRDAIDRMVAEAAYYLAEKRNFAPGYEQEDWLAAREQILSQFQAASAPARRNGRLTRR